MEVYKLGKAIENQKIEIQLSLHQLKEARDELQHSLKRRKNLAIQQNDTQCQEEGTVGLFVDKNSNEFDVAIVDLIKKNITLNEKVRNLKREQETQSTLLRETTELKRKAEEDRVMIEEDKILLANRLEEKSLDVQKILSIQLDMMSKLMTTNQELNRKVIE